MEAAAFCENRPPLPWIDGKINQVVFFLPCRPAGQDAFRPYEAQNPLFAGYASSSYGFTKNKKWRGCDGTQKDKKKFDLEC